MSELPAPIVVDVPGVSYVLYDLVQYAYLSCRGVGELVAAASGREIRIKVQGNSPVDRKLIRMLGPALKSYGMCEPGIWVFTLSLPVRDR